MIFVLSKMCLRIKPKHRIRMLDPRAEEVVPAWIKRFRRFDIFPKYDADIVIRTKAGGLGI